MTQDEMVEMAEQSGFSLTHSGLVKLWLGNSKDIEAFANLVAQHEREACAKVVEASPSYDWHKFACEAAYAIRARSKE